MSTASAAFQLALRFHRSGQLDQARELCRQVLVTEPQNGDAHHLLGLIALAEGHSEDAIESLDAATACLPHSAQFHFHLATAYWSADRNPQAIASYRKTISIEPSCAPAHNDLGRVLRVAGDRAEAEVCFREALRLDPQLAEAHNNLGDLLHEQQRLGEALAEFQEAARLRPDLFEIHFNLGNCYKAHKMFAEATVAYRKVLTMKPDFAPAHFHLGAMLLQEHQFAASADCMRDALRWRPDYFEAHNALGVALQALGKFAEAQVCFEAALRIDTTNADVRINLAGALKAQWKLNAAQLEYERAAQLTPGDPYVWLFSGNCWQAQGKFSEAIASYERAIELAPDVAEAHYYLAATRLTIGDFLAAWPDYEWRLKTRYAGPSYPQPRWNGEELHGKRILIHGEGGFGDTLQSIRYVPLVRQRGGDLTIAVQKKLITLLQSSGYERVVSWSDGSIQECELQVPILSLAGIFNTTPESIPAPIPYLAADPALVNSWRDKLQALPGFKVGIHWQGSNAEVIDFRSLPLAAYEPLARLPGVTLVSLQKAGGLDQLAELRDRFEVVDFGPDLDEAHGAFMDTAAIMKNLDLVVTCDTSIVHLAGALGVPVWVALSYMAEWRWLLDREDSPWYPTVRLFRQTRPGDWSHVFQRIATEVARLISADAPVP